MTSTGELSARTAALPAVLRLERAQARIRALTAGHDALSAADRLELAQWQREWVAAWRESEYVAAA